MQIESNVVATTVRNIFSNMERGTYYETTTRLIIKNGVPFLAQTLARQLGKDYIIIFLAGGHTDKIAEDHETYASYSQIVESCMKRAMANHSWENDNERGWNRESEIWTCGTGAWTTVMEGPTPVKSLGPEGRVIDWNAVKAVPELAN